MSDINSSTFIVIGIVVAVAAVAVAVFNPSKNTMPSLVSMADNKTVLTEFDKLVGGSRKNSKKRNRKSKKRR
jgi:predicted Rossmann fold nucleotide-binding protein DprA/Smf involved in DNA uptake